MTYREAQDFFRGHVRVGANPDDIIVSFTAIHTIVIKELPLGDVNKPLRYKAHVDTSSMSDEAIARLVEVAWDYKYVLVVHGKARRKIAASSTPRMEIAEALGLKHPLRKIG